MKIKFNNLNFNLLKANGRNGKILCFTKKGFKLKLSYRLIDFYLNFFYNNIFIYIKYVHDSFRNAKLILCLTIYGFYFYILGIQKLKLPCFYNLLFSFSKKLGTVVRFFNCREGELVSNFSFYENYYGQIARSAGEYAQVIKVSFLDNFTLLKLKSGKKFFINKLNNCMLGIICNSFEYNINIGKAGFNNIYGKKLKVRGVAMNPIDHPNGGRTPGGKVYRSFSYKIARNRKKTYNNNSFIKRYII